MGVSIDGRGLMSFDKMASTQYRILQVTTVLLVLMFGMAGSLKLFPHLIRDPDFVSLNYTLK